MHENTAVELEEKGMGGRYCNDLLFSIRLGDHRCPMSHNLWTCFCPCMHVSDCDQHICIRLGHCRIVRAADFVSDGSVERRILRRRSTTMHKATNFFVLLLFVGRAVISIRVRRADWRTTITLNAGTVWVQTGWLSIWLTVQYYLSHICFCRSTKR